MSLYANIKQAPHHKALVSLSPNTVDDLKFWLYGFDTYNGFRKIWQPTGFHTTIYTDAAGVNLKNFGGWAGWTRDSVGAVQIAKGIWDPSMGAEHSTILEIQAILNVLLSFNSKGGLCGQRVLVKTDNQGVFFIINKAGSRAPIVHTICKTLIWYCINQHIYLQATWIPRDLNDYADFYSKMTESSDWKLHPRIFVALQKVWGRFTIDLFASYDNHQMTPYYSFYWTPTCAGVDAFNFSWGRTCWCNPPFNQMARVIAHGMSCTARLCLICPFTPSAPWWHLITPDGFYFSYYVRDCKPLQKTPDMFLPGRLAYQHPTRVPRWHTMALLLNFACPMTRPCIPLPQTHDFQFQ